jgi:hypothetical protein
MKTYQTIEMGRGDTYSNSLFTVYEHGVYPRSSVLAGRASRKWLDDFDTLAEAVAAYPKADVCVGGTTWREDKMLDLPGEDDCQDRADDY